MLRSRLSFWAVRVLAALVVATALAIPFYLARQAAPGPLTSPTFIVPNTHDMAQHLAVMDQFDKVLRAGTLYPRWLPDVNGGYGLPWINYYPPGLYYLTSLINLLVNDWMSTMLIVSILGLAGSGLTFYILSRLFYGELASVIAALLYMAAPYHTLDLYWRGAIPEFLGFVLVPLILYFAFKLGSSGKARYFAGLGFFHGIYLLTHFPVAYLMTFVLTFYALSRAFRERDWKVAVRIGIGISIALFLGAIYWVPAALEADLVAEHFSRLFVYHKGYITLVPGGDSFADLINSSFGFLAVTLIASVWLLYSVRKSREAVSTEPVEPGGEIEHAQWLHTRQWVLMGIATTFMCTSFSYYISRLIPRIEAVSFPWRWLVITTFFTSLVAAAAIDRVTVSRGLSSRTLWVCRSVLAVAIGLNIWCTVQSVILPTTSHPLLALPSNFVESGFIPAGAVQPQSMPSSPLASVQPEGEVEVVRWEPMEREVRVNSGQAAILKLKTYNFAGWEARVDGQPAQLLNDVSGAQVVNLTPGNHTVEVFFVNTPARTLGAALTGLGFLVICGLIALDLVGRRKASPRGAAPHESSLPEAFAATPEAPADEERASSLER